MVKKILLTFLLILSLSTVFALNLTNQSKQDGDILIQNQSFIENISQTSKEIEDINPYKDKKANDLKLNKYEVKFDKITSKKLRSSNSKRIIMQFNKNPSKFEIKQLEKEGIQFLEYLGGNSYYVKLSKDYNKLFEIKNNDLKLKSKNINDKYLVRNTAEIKSEYKLSKNLREDKVKNWAKDKEGNIYLNVQFHKDVTLEEAEKLMNENGFEVISRLESINSLTIKVKGGEKSE